MENEVEEIVIQIKRKIKEKNIEEALKQIQLYEGEYCNVPCFLKVKAFLCMCVDEYNTAINILKKVEGIDPNDEEVYYYLTKCYEAQLTLCDTKMDYPEITIVNTDNKEPIQYDDDLNVYRNRDLAENLNRKSTDPLVSIFFLAYNNLEKYTKPAIEALLNYTKDIDYELILVDNGSSDGTFEYFKSLSIKNKRIYKITKNIGAGYGYIGASNACKGRFYRGKYIAIVPNDVLVTKNWLSNMMRCITSDEKIGLVVPMSSYSSNDEQLDLGYKNMEEMQVRAAEFNKSDPMKWEERLRAIPSVMLMRTLLWNMYKNDTGFIYSFLDDDISIIYRRLGYKLMVCADVFIYHAGSTIVGQKVEKNREDLMKGRQVFISKYYGIDPWSDFINFDNQVRDYLLLDCEKREENKVLGVDVRCGSPLLNLKNGLRKKGMIKTELSVFAQEAKYWLDLKTICDGEVLINTVDKMPKLLTDRYDYIILGEYLDEYDDMNYILNVLLDHLKCGGRIGFKLRGTVKLDTIQQMFDFLQSLSINVDANKEKVESFLRMKNKEISTIVYPLITKTYKRNKAIFFEALRQQSNHPLYNSIKNMYTEKKYDTVMKEYVFIIKKGEYDGYKNQTKL